MDLARYRNLFVTEAREHLKEFSKLLETLAPDPPPSPETVNELFRRAHSLKGMASTMQITTIATLAHALEELLENLRDGNIPFSRQLSELLMAASDTLEQHVELVAHDAETPSAEELVSRIRNFKHSSTEPQKHPSGMTLKDEENRQPAELLSSTVRIKTSLLDRLMALTGELLTVRHRLEAETDAIEVANGLKDPLRELAHLLKQLQTEVFDARMLPLNMLFERFPRMIRELARKTGKEAKLYISGESIEADRGILEALSDPLLHLLRNALDHGIEPPSERVAKGKPPVGKIELSANRLSDRLTITVNDDGRGMDPSRIRAKALKSGLINDNQASSITDDEALLLICRPGFSTMSEVTEISGRGVGMDVVKNSVQSSGGKLSIESTPCAGSRFTIELPMNISIIQALIVEAGGLTLAVPVISVKSTIEARVADMQTCGEQTFLTDRGTQIPLQNLARFFRLPDVSKAEIRPVLLGEVNGITSGLILDRITGQREIFVKPLSPPLSAIRGISGSTMTGEGQTLFVLDTAACLSS